MNKKQSKEITQTRLRRLMVEQKEKLSKSVDPSNIQSPLAKYIAGKLTCVICRTPVKTWKVHVNSLQHKKNIEAAKKLPSDLINQHQLKEKKTDISTPKLPTNQVTAVPAAYQKANLPNSQKQTDPTETPQPEGNLPDNFFDKQPQTRQRDGKDTAEEEWEKFQKAIKEESLASTVIIAGEQESATIDRQIQEINEQIFLWSKVVNLEDKKNGLRRSNLGATKSDKTDDEDSSDEDETFEEFANWRFKNSLNKPQH